METISLLEFRQNLTEYLNQSKYYHKRFVITRNGRIVGVFVPPEDLKALKALEEIEMQSDVETFDKAVKKHKANNEQTISHEEFKKRLSS